MVTMLARTKFFGQGHKLSGLDPARLGSTRGTLLTPTRGRRGPAAGTATSTAKEA
jgi:preprotein translocase subunit SecD